MPYLKDLRRKKGLTQARLAPLSGLGLSMLKKIECGRSRPSNETIFKLAKALDVIPEDIEVDSMPATTFLERTQRLRGITDTELVRKTGISRTTLQRLRRGGKPQSGTVARLAAALNAPPGKIGGPAYEYMTPWKRERLTKGISVAELAKRTGLSKQTIYNIEEGVYKPKCSKAREFGARVGDTDGRVRGGIHVDDKVELFLPRTNLEVPIMTTLRELRIQRGVSQRKLAQLARVHPMTISRLERGLFTPRPTTIGAICEALGVDFTDFPLGTIDRLKAKKGLSDSDLSKVAGISRGSLYHLRAGQDSPRADVVIKLATALGVSPADISGWARGYTVDWKRLRLAKGLTKKELSKLTGISRQTIYSLENGYSYPSTKTIRRLANVLDTSLICSNGEMRGR